VGGANPMARAIRVDQKYVGFIIGPSGSNLQHIKDTCGVVNVQIDQSTKEQGFSMVQIYGAGEGAERAARMIEAKLAEIDPTTKPQGAHEMNLEQAFVGFVLGKGGETLKTIKNRSGASIAIDQSTKEQGYSTIRIMGEDAQKRIAIEMLEAKIAEAREKQSGGGLSLASAGAVAPAPPPLGTIEVRIEQGFVGWLIGKGGETVRLIKEQTGCSIVIDQATKDQGFSLARVPPGPGQERARAMIEHKLSQARVESAGMSVQELSIPANAVGGLIGHGGENIKHIKDVTGANLVIDQATKDQGYCVVRITGHRDAVARAEQMVHQRLEEQSSYGRAPHAYPHAHYPQARDYGMVPPPSAASAGSGVSIPPPRRFGSVPPPNLPVAPPSVSPTPAPAAIVGSLPVAPPPARVGGFLATPPPPPPASMHSVAPPRSSPPSAIYDPFSQDEASGSGTAAYDPFA